MANDQVTQKSELSMDDLNDLTAGLTGVNF